MKKICALVLGLAGLISTPAMAEVSGSAAAANCFIAMSNTLYQVWPGVQALKVGRFFNDANRTYLYSLDVNEISHVCNLPGWHLSTWSGAGGSVIHNFRASSHAFQGGVPVYRFRHKVIGSYFYTSSYAEYMNTLNQLSASWVSEGIAFYVPDIYSTPMLLDQTDSQTGVTTRVSQYPLACANRSLEQVPGKPYPAICRMEPAPSTGLTPVYRFYSPSRGHFYTADLDEALSVKANSATNTYKYERVAFWAFSHKVFEQPDLPGWMTGVYYPSH